MPRDTKTSEPPLHNIPIRTDLGTKLRKLLREQRPVPRTLVDADFAKLEASLGATPCVQVEEPDVGFHERRVTPHVGLRVRRMTPHPEIPTGTLGTIDVVRADGQSFWVVTDTGGFNGWTDFDAWQPAGDA